MIKIRPFAALKLAAALSLASALSAAEEASAPSVDNDVIEEVFVIGKRRAYQGNFNDLEKPLPIKLSVKICCGQLGLSPWTMPWIYQRR